MLVVDDGLALLNQLFSSIFPSKGDEGEGLWFIVLHLVYRPDHLNDTAELLKVRLQVLLGESLSRWELAHVHLALACLSFLAGDLRFKVIKGNSK